MSIKHLDKIVSLCKRKGFVFPNSEIYGGLKASYDYGPLGVDLKKAISEKWWKAMTSNSNIVGLDSSIMVHPDVWEASGHVDNFNDPMTDNKDNKKRYRIDDLLSQQKSKVIDALCEALSIENKNDSTTIDKISEILLQESDKYSDALESAGVIDPFSGNIGKWTQATQFNLMFQTNTGPSEKTGKNIYLRPETAQGIYINYLLVQNSMRLKVPFGIAQIGKAFRNEIIARQFIFRMREFEQMEMQFFVEPGSEMKWYEEWKNKRMKWHNALGLGENLYKFHDHENLAHYANAACDIEFNFPMGFKELEGIHSRTDFDLKNHQKYSGKKINYFDQKSSSSFIPYVVETSLGLDRLFLAVISSSLQNEKLEDGSERVVLKVPFEISPVKVAVMPLNAKDGLPEKALKIYDELKLNFKTHYDYKDSIGKRYRRQDSIGTPFCITVDYDSLKDNSVTIRNRDSMEQERIPINLLVNHINKFTSINNLLKKI